LADFLKTSMEDLKVKVEKYLERAKPLFSSLTKVGGLKGSDIKRAEKVLDTALRYYSDAKHFYEKGEYLNALTALEYGEGWMDAGKETSLLDQAKN